MSDKTREKSAKVGSAVKMPIWRTLIISMVLLFFIMSALVSVFSYIFFSRNLYSQFETRLTNVINHVEKNIDKNDLSQCLETETTSSKYASTQTFLNGLIDDFKLKNLYIVIPKENVMVNVISATSAEERASGETDTPFLWEIDTYTAEELARYRSYWDTSEVNFFEETPDNGTHYTACKALRNGGETIALICADLSIEVVRSEILNMTYISILIMAVVFVVFEVIVLLLMRYSVTKPLFALEKSTRAFAEASHNEDLSKLTYDSPDIKTRNEVGSLAKTIESMTTVLKANIEKALKADERAAAAEKIAALSKSVSTLLSNMPALTFYKDVEEGRYMACNQSFAEYAGKQTPEEVVGLTDFDIFDQETASHFVRDDKTALSMDEPFVFFESTLDANGRVRQFQTTKLKFIDPEGETRILGMCLEVTEMMNIRRESEAAKEESLTYSRIARALSLDYTYLYYVSLTTDEFIEYHSTPDQEDISVERKGADFFGQSRRDASFLIHKDDQPVFLNSFTKENIIEKINSFGMFSLSYRLIVDGTPTYVNMKATRLKGNDDHIIIGVNNIDSQKKDQEAFERVIEERKTYARITALSGNYICIYTIDPETDDFIEYSATKDYEGLGLDKTGKNFFEVARNESVRTLYLEDVSLFLSVMTKENILSAIEKNGFFAFNYRLMINGKPTYVTLKAAMVEENDGPQIIVGVSNVDAQIKREQDYANELFNARRQADMDALTGVKNKHAYIDVEAQLNKRIDEKEPVQFAIVICDINNLKEINDTKGHVAGDEYICGACNIICDVFKHSPVFRVGGDEFAVIAQGKDYLNIDELISAIAKINRDNAQAAGITFAYGMAKYDKDRSVSAVFERADMQMYQNKRNSKI